MDNDISLQAVTSSQRRPAVLVCIALVTIAVVVVLIAAVRRAAEREYASYKTLCSLGATGDDWVSILEFVTGRPPIVQIRIPACVSVHTTFALLPDLHNLDSLTVAYDSLSDEQLDAIRNLGINSLCFEGDFPSDADVNRLSRFRGVRFVHIPSGNLSAEGRHELRGILRSSEVVFD